MLSSSDSGLFTTASMKPESNTEKASKDKVRKSLHVLQPSATNKENLVGAGRMLRSSKEKPKTDTSKSDNKHKKLKPKEKATQTIQQIAVEDLTSEAAPSENYWEILAERRRIALQDTLEENKVLTERIEKLREENNMYKEMLNETRALVEVLQEMVGDDRNEINNSLDDSAL